MIQETKAIAQTLTDILGPAAVRDWENIEVSQQKHISQTVSSGTTASCIVYPNTQEELAQVIACAHQQRWRILPCGSGSKLSWGGLVQADPPPLPPQSWGGQEGGREGIVVISTSRINRAIEHAVGDLTITVEAGAKFSDIQAILAKAGQFIALDPSYPQTATIGGIVATADAGSLRQRYGGVRDMLLGISFVRADGQIAKAGGRVVKNVAGYDLMKLFAGSFGTLGIISQATFRVYPLPEASQTVVLTGTGDAIAQATKTLLASALTPTAVDLRSTQVVTNLGLGKGMGLITRFQSMTESVKQQSNRLLEVGQTLGLQCSSYTGNDEAELWQKLAEQIWASGQEPEIICKIGMQPTAAVATLTLLDNISHQQGIGLIHAGSGLGLLRFNPENALYCVTKMRSHCQSHSGFLTVLEAPISFKQHIDVWGYSGNAIDLMRQIKQQFDPENILSPHRFVAGI